MAKVPEFTGSAAVFLREVDEYKKKVLQKKYDVVLEFLKKLSKNDNMTYLCQFTNIPASFFERDMERKKKVVIEYCSIFNTRFGTNFRQKDISETPDTYVKYFLSKILKLIDYRLISRKNYDGDRYYKIVKN